VSVTFWRHSCSGSWWARALCTWCSLFLLAGTAPSWSGESQSLISSIERRLLSITAYSQRLETELGSLRQSSEQNEQRAKELLNELGQQRKEAEALRSELENWQTHSAEAERQVAALLALQAGLETKLKRLSESCDALVQSWRDRALAAEARERAVKIKAVLGGIVALALGVLIGSLVGRHL